MESRFDRVTPEVAWLGTVLALVVALVGGALAFPGRVYDGFIWQYFWGPVVADGHGAVCAVRAGGATELLYSQNQCMAADGYVAYPGYTLVSEIGYAMTLILMLLGVVFLLQRLDIGDDRGLFYALLPFMFLGGTLRVVEDAFVALQGGAESVIPFPWSALIISPFIYFTMFAFTLAALVVSIGLERDGRVDRYELPLAGSGAVALALALMYLLVLAATTPQVSFHPQIAVLTLIASTLVAWVTWVAVQRYAPEVNRGTETLGFVILWGHAVDGVANVIGLDWATELGLSRNLVPKHPVNQAIVVYTDRLLPESVTYVTGTAWPFLLVKVAAALFVVWIFDEEIFEESPQYALLLLIAILAVGLGPGTRDFLRATFGI